MGACNHLGITGEPDETMSDGQLPRSGRPARPAHRQGASAASVLAQRAVENSALGVAGRFPTSTLSTGPPHPQRGEVRRGSSAVERLERSHASGTSVGGMSRWCRNGCLVRGDKFWTRSPKESSCHSGDGTSAKRRGSTRSAASYPTRHYAAPGIVQRYPRRPQSPTNFAGSQASIRDRVRPAHRRRSSRVAGSHIQHLAAIASDALFSSN